MRMFSVSSPIAPSPAKPESSIGSMSMPEMALSSYSLPSDNEKITDLGMPGS
jgi:hypothetical protein